MRQILKFVALAFAAFVFSVVVVTAETATFDDALRDFLDDENRKKMMDYWNATNGFRVIGMTLMLAMWTAVVLGIDRIVDLAAAKRKPETTGRSH
jgi:hypothetical protein